ncbi:MAG: hypothetical protein HYV96_02040 [Opitutae bacterium]|nr:hypothetical protein [Opitutae bacterium]
MNARSKERRGFALLLTLALLSFVLLLLLGLVAVVRLEAQAAVNAGELARARANARLALWIAIGQLQRYTGGDGIVTARADVAGAAVANPAWTGVWRANDSLGAVTWLVSGNENTPLALTPDTALSDAEAVWLLKRNLAASEQVRARRMAIDAVPTGESAARTIGRYAFWVGDESLKVSMNVRTDVAPPPGYTVYPVPRTQSVFSSIAANSTNDARAKLLVVDQLLLPPFNVNGNTLNALWPAVTAAAPRLHFPGVGAGQLIPGSFNANTRSQAAWNAYLDTLTLTVSRAAAYAAIRDAARPFRSTADFQAKLAANSTVGVTNAATIAARLAPVLCVRGDTFLVRAYGDAVNLARQPGDADYIAASAYCEALVQRTAAPAGAFGYRYVVVYFRWLAAEDI